jgi:hypothetical protein
MAQGSLAVNPFLKSAEELCRAYCMGKLCAAAVNRAELFRWRFYFEKRAATLLLPDRQNVSGYAGLSAVLGWQQCYCCYVALSGVRIIKADFF